MPYDSLRDFIARLEREGRLVRVAAPVSPHLEMTEIQTRLEQRAPGSLALVDAADGGALTLAQAPGGLAVAEDGGDLAVTDDGTDDVPPTEGD